jgi:protein-tyrosine phosphatase
MGHSEAIAVENDRLATLARQKTATPPTAEQFKQSGAMQGPAVAVNEVMDEQQVVTRTDAGYLRLTVTDHLRPQDGEVDRFLAALAGHPADGRIHVHCRGGDGRTTTFMAMVDMLANADKVTAEAIFARQATVSPFYDLAKVAAGPKAVYYRERLEFLQRFHAYAVARKAGETKTWSQWAKG